MSENCNHECSSCSEECSEKKSFILPQNPMSNIKKVIGIVSGKGGVGKSLITSMMAVMSRRNGFKTAVLDADITGPSIPKMFGITEKAYSDGTFNIPCVSKTGIEIMSVNLLLERDTYPVIWRGPIIAGMVQQFWTDVAWGDIDYMFIDMSPGTGDVPLTVFQSIPVDGLIIVTSPQELVSMIVEKAVNMANTMNMKIAGIIENMSYIECPDCKKKINMFGESNIDEIASNYGMSVLAKLPLDPQIAKYCDDGNIESANIDNITDIMNVLEKL